MSNDADKAANPQLRFAHPRLGYAYSASKGNTVKATAVGQSGDVVQIELRSIGQPKAAVPTQLWAIVVVR